MKASVIDIVIAEPAWRGELPEAGRICRRAARAALAASGIARRVELCVRLSDDDELRRLNRAYRETDRPTNVLAFPASDDPDRLLASDEGDQPILVGDVALALGTAKTEAERGGVPLAAHTVHLVVHGVLHLLGHDHGDEAEARRMDALEANALNRLGVAHPHHHAARAVSAA
ncbi:MAG: rRNA maturation RNase YbeY [Proteobacteria bacterium]|nr:rRNA maturation RNase YbeY [Pseudomonadota bacterium]